MNKLYMLAFAGLLFSSVNNALAMGQEQMEILHTLYALDQDFAQVPMIVQNIDMFMGVTEMKIQLTEIKLKNATKELKTALWKNAALFTGGLLGRQAFCHIVGKSVRESFRDFSLSMILKNGGVALGTIIGIYLPALNLYDAWKKRSELTQAVALDKEILSKLQEIKYSIDSAMGADNSETIENILLENVA